MNKHRSTIQLKTNSFIDDGDGVVSFPNGLTITDTSEQWNGTKYDIASMDLDTYKGQLTADHSMGISDVIGRVVGVAKSAEKVVVDNLVFAVKENALARYAYNMIKGGFLTDFSIETIGPPPNEEGIYFNSQLVGLSLVVMGNNKSATINEVVKNSINEAKVDGLDTTELEMLVTDETSEGGESMNTENTKNQAEGVVEEPKTEEPKAETATNGIEVQLNAALKPLMEKLGQLEQKVFDNSAKEPVYEPVKNAAPEKTFTQKYGNLDWRQFAGEQVNAAWDALKGKSAVAAQKLADMNEYNFERLQEEGVVPNSITIADFGNFVISPELFSKIEGHRSNYSDFLNLVGFRETLSTQMAWLKRSGDINMQEVEMCDDGADGNLKPISTYSANINQANLHELAAVTPICNAATRFLAADLIEDAIAGYRNDYDRKLAQLVIARLQQAVDNTGNSVSYNKTSSTTALQSFITAMAEVQEEVMGGVYVFSHKSWAELMKEILSAGISGPLATIFTTGDQPMIWGRPYVVVPNELLPSLNTANTLSFTVEGTSVSIDHGVFYFDPSTFAGRTSGGLQFDLSTEAAYEEDATVKSAFQRNELVMRGSFFRNGAVKDEDKVVGLTAAGVS